MKGKNMGGWRPVLGTLAVGILALTVSLRLEGAPAVPSTSREKSTDARSKALRDESSRPATRILQNDALRTEMGDSVRAGAVSMPGVYQVDPPITVNYLEDEGTRGRQLGLFTGPMPKQGQDGGVTANVPAPRRCIGGSNANNACSSDANCPGVANGTCTGGNCVGGLSPGSSCTDNEDCFGSHCGCSFAIHCDDGQPCTVDRCSLDSGEPAGSGKCVNSTVQNGSDQPVDSSCSIGLECGGCNDHIACNGIELCQGGACAPGQPVNCGAGAVCNENGRCAGGGQAGQYCREDVQCPGSTCNHCQSTCSSNAQCDDGVLCNGSETCSGGTCLLGTPPCGPGGDCGEKRCSTALNNPWFCNTTDECVGGGTCTVAGPICLPGRCCDNANPQPGCTRRGFNTAMPGGVGSCNSIGGEWFAGTDGNTEPNRSAYNSTCPSTPPPGLRCPKYGDGIAPQNVGPLVGPVTDGYRIHPGAGVALNKLGDDYTLTDSGNILLDEVRWIGGRLVEERISFEFYDEFGNFVEDLFVITPDNGITVKTVEFEPALEIPGKGFMVLTVASAFAPDTRFYWASTNSTAVDVGSNDVNVLWVNNGPTTNFLTGSNRNLAFELVGRKTVASVGGCCLTSPGPVSSCDNGTSPWTCEGQGGVYLGNAQQCAACVGGPNTGLNCRSCSNNLALACQRNSDCGVGNTCIPDNGDCPSGVCTATAVCNSGACCNNGACTETTPGGCAGTFQGFGTSCDHDGGYDAAEQNCCPQTIDTTSDNCGDATMRMINVPAPGSDPVTVTITGNNLAASSTPENPDSSNFCAPTNDPEADTCWWEAFTIDACAYVRIDTCCTGNNTNVFRPAWGVLFPDCPGGGFLNDTPNPHSPLIGGQPEPSFNRGGPYCGNDNIWFWFGPLPAGDYYHPVYSALLGYHGQYQMHFTVQACPVAACCIESSCQILNELDCTAAGGYYLGPPNKYPAVSTCSGTTCAQGSCCTDPGVCVDRDLDPGVTELECETELDGRYVGGTRCFGGTCATDSTISCSSSAQCPGAGACNGDNQQLNAPTPCPICEIVGAANCQIWEDQGTIGTVSDRSVGTGLVSADDFIPLGPSITSVCAWGLYLDGTAGDAPELDCGQTVTADNFRIRVFDDFEGLPCNLVAESTGTSARAVIPGALTENIDPSIQTWGFQITLDSPITGLDGSGATIYWLEVSNQPDGPVATCAWFWDQLGAASSQGNNYSAAGSNAGYPAGSERILDYSWCLNANVTAGASGDIARSCCSCNTGTCSLTTLADCIAAVGIWDVDASTCGPCATGAPPNDLCSSTVGNDVGEGTYFFDAQCAGTDGPAIQECTELGPARMEPDVWYRFCPTVECNLTVSMCQTGTSFDSMIGVYFKAGDPNFCPTDAAFLDGCHEDESCTGTAVGGAGVHILEANPAQPGECYVIRAGGFNGAKGSGSVDISCPPTSASIVVEPRVADANRGIRDCEVGGAAPQALLPDPTGIAKNRYISFVVPAPATAANETAIQVTLTDLMNPTPPNLPQFPAPNFSAFEGQRHYVGTPTNCQETESPPTSFKCAALQCAPVYVDWQAAIGGATLHVQASSIVPSSTYTVRQLPAACTGSELSCSSASDPLVVTTQRWGDAVVPFQNPSGALNQPNVSDIAAAVDKFKELPGAIIRARGDMHPGTVNLVVNIADVAAIVDAFKSFAYPFTITLNCP